MLEGMTFDNFNSPQAVVEACQRIEENRKKHEKDKEWLFYSSGTSGTYSIAEEYGNLRCNAHVGVTWVLKAIDTLPENCDTLYNNEGELGTEVAVELLTPHVYKINFEKPLEELAEKRLQPGDIIVFKDISHMCIFLGKGAYFDTGQTYLKGDKIGEGSPYEKWIGGTKYSKEVVQTVIRLKKKDKVDVPKPEIEDKLEKVDQITISRKYWVGDSRFVGMKDNAKGDDVFICKVSMGHSWLESTAIPQLKKQLKNKKGEVVIFGLGVNDLYKVDKYINTYKAFIKEYPNVSFIFMSVNPVDDSKSSNCKNKDIENFNKKLQSNFSKMYLDTYSQIKNQVTGSSTDGMGVHYNKQLNKAIYDMVNNKVHTAVGGSSAESDGIGDGSNGEVDIEAIKRFFVELFNFNIKNNIFSNGNLLVKGYAGYKLGERVITEYENMEYYIESVTQNFNCYGTWTTQLGVTRGIEPQLRFTPPYGAYEEMTPATLNAIIMQSEGTEIDWTNLPEVQYTIGGGQADTGTDDAMMGDDAMMDDSSSGGSETDSGGSMSAKDKAWIAKVYGIANEGQVVKAVSLFCKHYMGLNRAATAGIIGNMKQESGLKCHIDGDRGTSYGLCQWHNTRKRNLQKFCKEHGYGVNYAIGQLMFMKHELETSYRKVYEVLKTVPNNSNGAYNAAYEFCVRYETPANKYTKAKQRGDLAKMYFSQIRGYF